MNLLATNMPQPQLALSDVLSVLKGSENKPTLYEGRDQRPDGTGHAAARHYLITNTGLADRLWAEGRNGSIAFFAAFITQADMVAAAAQVLNGPAGLWAREQLFDQAATARRARGSHTGMRAVIEHQGIWSCDVRYPSGTGKMPANTFRMLLDRIDSRYLRLHIHTFFPSLGLRPQPSWSEVKYRDGTLFSRWP